MKKVTNYECYRMEAILEKANDDLEKNFKTALVFADVFEKAEKKTLEDVETSFDVLKDITEQFQNALGNLEKVEKGQEIVLKELENIRKGFTRVEKRFSVYTLGKYDELEQFQDKCCSSQRFVEDTFDSLCSTSYAFDLMSELDKLELEIVTFT